MGKSPAAGWLSSLRASGISAPSPDRHPELDLLRYGPRHTSLRAGLEVVLGEARRYGFLGPGPLALHLGHSAGFARLCGYRHLPARVVDLGSGGGVPGLVLAVLCSAWEMTLVESQSRRAEFLERAVEFLGLQARVTVLPTRAETLSRDDPWRETFREAAQLVLARSFGPPAVVAECASPLLAIGGKFLVSEPPSSGSGPSPAPGSERWPGDGLAQLGLEPATLLDDRGRFHYMMSRKGQPCPDAYPRRVGVPSKRPLW